MNSLKTICLAKLIEGLCHLIVNKEERRSPHNSSFINFSMTTPITKSNFWHFRLGHLSRKRLNILNELFPSISRHTLEACDICYMAKQKKLSYSTSMNKASKIF